MDTKQKGKFAAFFVIGISLLAVGISTKNTGLLAAGIVFMIISIVQRKKQTGKEEKNEPQIPDESGGSKQ